MQNYCICGKANPLGSVFCNRCGKKIGETTAATPKPLKPIKATTQEDDEDGVSLEEFEPQINKIEVEILETDIVPSISLGTIFEQARQIQERNKNAQRL